MKKKHQNVAKKEVRSEWSFVVVFASFVDNTPTWKYGDWYSSLFHKHSFCVFCSLEWCNISGWEFWSGCWSERVFSKRAQQYLQWAQHPQEKTKIHRYLRQLILRNSLIDEQTGWIVTPPSGEQPSESDGVKRLKRAQTCLKRHHPSY